VKEALPVEIERFLSVLDPHEIIGKVPFLQRADGHLGVGGAVFDEQNFDYGQIFHAPLPFGWRGTSALSLLLWD